jgi:hypothetical protein
MQQHHIEQAQHEQVLQATKQSAMSAAQQGAWHHTSLTHFPTASGVTTRF